MPACAAHASTQSNTQQVRASVSFKPSLTVAQAEPLYRQLLERYAFAHVALIVLAAAVEHLARCGLQRLLEVRVAHGTEKGAVQGLHDSGFHVFRTCKTPGGVV